MKIGIDIVDIKRFEQTIQTGGESFLNQHFSSDELIDRSAEHLAGLFAVKEAIYKTGYAIPLNFLALQIIPNTDGKPEVYTSNGEKNTSLEISISHTDTIAIGVAVWV